MVNSIEIHTEINMYAKSKPELSVHCSTFKGLGDAAINRAFATLSIDLRDNTGSLLTTMFFDTIVDIKVFACRLVEAIDIAEAKANPVA